MWHFRGLVAKLNRILIIQTAFLGDVVLATALAESLRAAMPHASIDFLVRKGTEGVLYNHPHVHQVIVFRRDAPRIAEIWRLVRAIRQARYERIVVVQRFFTAGLLGVLGGAAQVVGFDKNPWSRFFTRRVPHVLQASGNNLHEIERNHQLIAPWAQPALPKVYPSVSDQNTVALYQHEPYVCVAPASVWHTKQWPEDKWMELVNRISTRVYLLGAPADLGLCERIVSAAPQRCTVLAGKLSLLQSAALMAGAQNNFVNDSAPLHLCTAVGAPLTAVFCSTVPAFGFGPLPGRGRVVQTGAELPCRPCGVHGKKACPLGHFKCADVEVSAVIGE